MVILSKDQQHATEEFKDFILNPEETAMVISGPAGTGKSFLVRHLADIADASLALVSTLDKKAKKISLVYAATTNKAANVLGDLTNRESSTIHKILGLTVKIDYKTGKTSLITKGNAPVKLNNTILFIDEASMISKDLMKILNKCLEESTNTKFVYIGDSYQLPPVKEKACAVFKTIPKHVTLTEIQRQVAHNPVLKLAHQYRALLDDHTIPFPEIIPDNIHICHYENHDAFKAEIARAYMQPHAPDDLRITAWTNRHVVGYNRFVRKKLGLPVEFQVGEYVLVNSPILSPKGSIILSTDSSHKITNIRSCELSGIKGQDISFTTANTQNGSATVFFPSDITQKNMLLKKLAKEKNWDAFYDIKNRWGDFRPIYATTVHKAQGSTYREVFVDLQDIGKNNKWDETAKLAYVAITRASDVVHIYGNITKNYNRVPTVDRMKEFNHALL